MGINTIKLSTKIFTIVVLMSVVLIVISLGGINTIKDISNNVVELFDDRVSPLSQLKSVSDAYAVGIVDATHKANLGIELPTLLRRIMAQKHWKW